MMRRAAPTRTPCGPVAPLVACLILVNVALLGLWVSLPRSKQKTMSGTTTSRSTVYVRIQQHVHDNSGKTLNTLELPENPVDMPQQHPPPVESKENTIVVHAPACNRVYGVLRDVGCAAIGGTNCGSSASLIFTGPQFKAIGSAEATIYFTPAAYPPETFNASKPDDARPVDDLQVSRIPYSPAKGPNPHCQSIEANGNGLTCQLSVTNVTRGWWVLHFQLPGSNLEGANNLTDEAAAAASMGVEVLALVSIGPKQPVPYHWNGHPKFNGDECAGAVGCQGGVVVRVASQRLPSGHDLVVDASAHRNQFYDPMKFPEMPKTEDTTLPLTDRWKMYENISIVWTWVNGSVQADKDGRRKFGGEGKVDNSQSRENNELLYSFRSYEKHMSWHKGRIFIVSPGHVPRWLNFTHPRITIVHQNNLFPDQSALPSFNTMSIEFFLHRIPGLGKFFIHINDDYLFGADIHPSNLFLPGPLGGVRMFMGPGVINYPQNRNTFVPNQNIWRAATLRTWDTLEAAYGPTPHYALAHVPFVYYRDAGPFVLEKWAEHVKANLEHKFRHHEDVVPPLLFNYWTINEGGKHGMYFDLARNNELRNDIAFMGFSDNIEAAIRDLEYVRQAKPRFYNINDFFNRLHMRWLIQKHLLDSYPQPSQYERSDFVNSIAPGSPEVESAYNALVEREKERDRQQLERDRATQAKLNADAHAAGANVDQADNAKPLLRGA